MKLSSFSVILTFVILMIIGVALAPLIDVGTEPTPRQGKRMTIKYEWPHVSAKVVEQNLTSPIEGMVSALKGVESVSSKSYFGKSEIVVNLKENVDVSSVRFEISSLLRQSHERLPKGVSYPTLMGGEVVSGMASHNAQKLLLTYLVNADIQPELIKNFVKENVVRQLEAVDGVNKVEVTGTTDTYVEISYDPMALSAYGITSNDIANGIRNYIGQDEIIGTVMHTTAQGNQEKIALHLTTELFGKPLGEMPLKNIDGKVVYLNDLAAVQVKNQDPDSYYRVNGLNTVYINVYIPSDGKTVRMSDVVQEKMEQAGMTVQRGKLGNVVGIYPGETDRRIVLGSHIDSVPNGGMFDGCLGVMGAIEAVRALHEKGICLRHTVEVVAFAEEKGATISSLVGSRRARTSRPWPRRLAFPFSASKHEDIQAPAAARAAR